MANPTQNFGQVEKADLQHSTFDLSSHNYMTGRIGYLYPCFRKEVLAGDKVTLKPAIDLQMSPTVKQLKTKLKMVYDYFFVPFQAVWKNYPYFVNQGMNGVGQIPTIPYHEFAQGSSAVCNGSLFDYLGVPTLTPQNATSHKRFNLCPFTTDKNDSAYEQGYWFGLQANKANSWSADTKTSKSLRCGEFFSNVVKEYKKVPLEVLSKLHDKDSLGQHTSDSSSPYGKILHSVAIGSRIACSTDYIFSTDNPDADLQNGVVGANGQSIQSTYFGNNGGKLKKNQYITKPIADNAIIRFPNSHLVGLGSGLVPTASNSHSEVVVMFDYYGRPIKSYMNNSNTTGVDDFTISVEMQNNSAGGYLNSGSPASAIPDDKYYTACYVLEKTMIDDINYYLTTENGKKGISFGFYTFYDKSVDKLTVNHLGVWSPCLNDSFASQKANSTAYDTKNGAPSVSFRGAYTTGSTGSYTTASTCELHWYLGKSFTIPLTTSALGSIDVESTKPYALDANNNIAVKLNAFYARAYEAIYNYMYRNRNIDPLTDSSNRRVINQYLRDDYMTDGADTHDYKLHKALLEKDRFTTCLTASLINHTPLVGIRHAGSGTDATTMTFSVDGNPVNVYLKPTTSPSSTSPHGVTIDGYDAGLPQGTLNVIKNTIENGITIRDIQSVKQLQNWLHKHIECGYNFSEICLNTTGVKTKWNPNTSPMYLGGTAEILNNGNILSMAGDNLGERCGNPTAVSSHENTISFFAPDAGVIMGIVRLVPEVVYSQMIDPLYLKHDYWQFYNASMDNKGYESITCKQFMPQLAYAESKLEDVFGYQVPWSDYKFTQDEAHADARTTERDMMLYREFAQCPSLDKSFLECDPDDYDHIFRSTSSLDDKFYLVTYTNAIFSRPIGNPQDIL